MPLNILMTFNISLKYALSVFGNHDVPIFTRFSAASKTVYTAYCVFLSEERSKKYEIKVCAVSILVSATLLHARLKEGIEHLSIE